MAMSPPLRQGPPARPTRAPAGLVLLLLVAAGCEPAAGPPAPVLYRRGLVEINGRMDEPDWEDAGSLPLTDRGDYGDARLIWDADHLYLLVQCRRAERLSEESLILQVTGGRRLHFKFEPDGACWDLRAAAPSSAAGRPEVLRYAVDASEGGEWTVEARVPLLSFGAVGSEVTLHVTRLGACERADPARPCTPLRVEVVRRLSFRAAAEEAGPPEPHGEPLE